MAKYVIEYAVGDEFNHRQTIISAVDADSARTRLKEQLRKEFTTHPQLIIKSIKKK